jgi:hypothetical protein
MPNSINANSYSSYDDHHQSASSSSGMDNNSSNSSGNNINTATSSNSLSNNTDAYQALLNANNYLYKGSGHAVSVAESKARELQDLMLKPADLPYHLHRTIPLCLSSCFRCLLVSFFFMLFLLLLFSLLLFSFSFSRYLFRWPKRLHPRTVIVRLSGVRGGQHRFGRRIRRIRSSLQSQDKILESVFLFVRSFLFPIIFLLLLCFLFSAPVSSCSLSILFSGGDKCAYYLTAAIYFPFSPFILSARREEKVLNLVDYISSYDQAFLKNYRARALNDSIRFGASVCRTVAFVDLLCFEQEETNAFPIGKPSIPSVLVAHGMCLFAVFSSAGFFDYQPLHLPCLILLSLPPLLLLFFLSAR